MKSIKSLQLPIENCKVVNIEGIGALFIRIGDLGYLPNLRSWGISPLTCRLERHSSADAYMGYYLQSAKYSLGI